MDEYINDLDYEVDKMFSELYGDMTYNEPPEIENDVEELDEDSFFSSLSSPASEPEEMGDEKGYDELVLDKVSEMENEAPESPSEEDKETGKEEETLESFLGDMDYSDTLSDSELKGVSFNTEDPVIEEETAEIPEETEVENNVSEDEIISPAMEYSSSDNETSYEDNIIIEEAYDEPELENNRLSIIDFIVRFNKVFAFAAMLILLIGIPVIFSLLANGNRNNKSSKKKTEEVAVTEASTESWINIDEDLANSNGFDEVQEAAYNSMTETNMSSRFDTLDDLTFYLNSNMASILAYEKALATQYTNGTISSDYYYSELSVYLEYTDTLNHLLTINKNTYKNEGKEDEYNTLVDDMDALILYGDTLYYGSDSSSKTE